jgi:hypothetical protein
MPRVKPAPKSRPGVRAGAKEAVSGAERAKPMLPRALVKADPAIVSGARTVLVKRAGKVRIAVEVPALRVTEPRTPAELRVLKIAGEGPFFIVIESSSLRLFGDVCSRLLFPLKAGRSRAVHNAFGMPQMSPPFVLCLFRSNLCAYRHGARRAWESLP